MKSVEHLFKMIYVLKLSKSMSLEHDRRNWKISIHNLKISYQILEIRVWFVIHRSLALLSSLIKLHPRDTVRGMPVTAEYTRNGIDFILSADWPVSIRVYSAAFGCPGCMKKNPRVWKANRAGVPREYEKEPTCMKRTCATLLSKDQARTQTNKHLEHILKD